jgi:hypothetical protein
LHFEATTQSLAKGVVRLFATQSNHTPVAERNLRGIVLLGVDSGDGGATIGPRIASAQIDEHTSGSIWTVTAHVGQHKLSVEYDLVAHKSIRRTIDGQAVSVTSPLNINGRPIVP